METSTKQLKKDRMVSNKVALRIFIVILSLAVLIVMLITVYSTTKFNDLAFGNYSFYIMRSDSSMYAALNGDLVIAKKTKPGELNIGDYVVYGGKKKYYCDEIAQIKNVNIVNQVITAESNGVSYQLNENDVSGKVVKNIHNLGNMISFFRTPMGIAIFSAFIVCLFLLLRVLIISVKN